MSNIDLGAQLTRGLKFLKFYLCSENKGTDQLSYNHSVRGAIDKFAELLYY